MKTATKNLIQFDQAMKLFKKFVATGDARPVLKLVHFDGKYLVATNSHVLLRLNAEHISDLPENLETGSLIDPKINYVLPDKMNYPDTSRLIPNHYNTKAVIDGNIKEFHSHVKAAKALVKKKVNHTIKLDFRRLETALNAEFMQDDKLNEYKATMNNLYVTDEEFSLHVSAKYLDDTLTTIKKLSKLSFNDVELQIISSLRPIVFTQENVFDIIVLPVRIN